MRAIVACEFSGRVRDALIAKGIDAVSCDLLPTERPGPHIQGDIRDVSPWEFDLLVAHPPCTYLCNSGVRWLYNPDGSKNKERWDEMVEAAEFFKYLLDVFPVKRKVIENPIPHKYALKIIGRKYDQVIQPYEHGDGETKATCLWLKDFQPLQPTALVSGRVHRVHRMPPGPERWKERSRTYPGIAAAIAAYATI